MKKLDYVFLFENGIDKQEASNRIMLLLEDAKYSVKGANELIIKIKQGLTFPITLKEFCEYLDYDKIYFAELFSIIDEAKPRQLIVEKVVKYLEICGYTKKR